jgi:mRNA interferase MazF
MRRGEIWLTNLNPPRGREIGKMSPVLVVQSDELLAIDIPLVVVLPLTT